MTAADVSASAELQAAMADKAWHPEGEALSASRQHAFCGSTYAAGCRQRCLLRLASECLVAVRQPPPPQLKVYLVGTPFNVQGVLQCLQLRCLSLCPFPAVTAKGATAAT
jgi:hypothetical protein